MLIVLATLTFSCKKSNWDSYDDPPRGAKVIVANPLTVTLKKGNMSGYVSVNVQIIVTAINASAGTTTTYSTKNLNVPAQTWGTPGHIEVSGVNLPSNGPFAVQAILQTYDCNIFAQNCNAFDGGKQSYMGQYSTTSTSSSPNLVHINSLSFLNSNCCN